MNDGVVIDVQGLRVRRGNNLVLDGVTLGVRRGVVTGLLGPSGSGKTTLMRALAGVQIVEGGSVTVLGRPAGAPDIRHRVGYVTQMPSVYLDLTVGENLRYFARILSCPDVRTAEVLAIVGLEGHADRVVQTLSGGEWSRVSLAVALLTQPEVLVLDEPTVGLDPRLRRDLWGTFRELAARGTTLLVSTHVMDEAERCDDLILMRAGQIVATGTLPALLTRTGTADIESAFLALAEA